MFEAVFNYVKSVRSVFCSDSEDIYDDVACLIGLVCCPCILCCCPCICVYEHCCSEKDVHKIAHNAAKPEDPQAQYTALGESPHHVDMTM